MNVLTVPTIATIGLTVPILKLVSHVNANQERDQSFIPLISENYPISDIFAIKSLAKVPKETVLNAFKKTNVSLENIHVTSLPPVPMLTSPLNALVPKDMMALASVLPMVVADASILTNATMVLQIAQIIPPATTTTVATIVTVM